MIIGKSDSDNFDSFVFACRDVEEVTIPSYIKHIEPSSFQECSMIKSFSIPENSELQSIGKKAFFDSSIERFTIPKSVEIMDKYSFSYCEKLTEFIFEKGSKLLTFSENVFRGSNLEIITNLQESNIQSFQKIHCLIQG